jgi:tetratricopeptide (TPR) repeat protein
MNRKEQHGEDITALEELIEEIIVDAYGEDEQLSAFCQVVEDEVPLPADGFVIGEPVSVVEIDYDGNERRGLTARCRREDGSEHVVAASEVVFPEGTVGERYIAAYRKWLGLDPYPPISTTPSRQKRRHKATSEDMDLSRPVNLIALSVKQRTARCSILGTERIITLRASRVWDVVPGEIVTVKPSKQWSYAGHPYLSGKIESTRIDVAALGLAPLRIEKRGLWDPQKHHWGEEHEPIEEWAKPIIAQGPRPEFVMEQVLPGFDPDDPFSDPISESNDLKDAGQTEEALKLLMDLCESDLRCLEAHAHLGNFVFDLFLEIALRHYEVGFRIGEWSLGKDFDGLLPWGHIDNRPFLRCMHGYGLCLWRLGRFDEAGRIFERILRLNPSDNQGIRFLIGDVSSRKAWEADRNGRSCFEVKTMDLNTMKDTAPWDWPKGAGKQFLRTLLDEKARPSVRLLAAELAGNITVFNDELARALLVVLANPHEPADLRGQAVISLGPALEQADVDDFENPLEVPITEQTFRTTQETLHKLYMDADVPKELRRRILEASVRAPQSWHEDAVRKAYFSNDDTWNLTAVFCMRFVPGFESEIMESLKSPNQDIQYQAVCAAGNWGVEAAWPHISTLLESDRTEKDLLLAAIDAAAGIRPGEAEAVLSKFTNSDDEDVVDAAYEAMAMAGVEWEDEDYDFF